MTLAQARRLQIGALIHLQTPNGLVICQFEELRQEGRRWLVQVTFPSKQGYAWYPIALIKEIRG